MVPPTPKPASRKRRHAATFLCASLVAQHLSVPVSSFAPAVQVTSRDSSKAATATAPFHGRLLHDRRRKATSLMLTYHDGGDDNDEDDEEETSEGGTYGMVPKPKHDDIISEMIDSIEWMPSVYDMEDDATLQSASSIRKDSRILPFLPLTEVFVPFSDHTLSIYEQRYIELYDWLLDDEKNEGKPELVVSLAHPSEDGIFASYGVLFKIKDFVEMDETEAQDIYGDEEGQLPVGADLLAEESSAVKYVATHTATKIVKIRKVLNPASWEREDTYLRVEAVVTDDFKDSSFQQVDTSNDGAAKKDNVASETGTGSKAPRKWKSDEGEGALPRRRQQIFYEDVLDLRESFFELVKTQHELKEDIKFSKDSGRAFARGITEGHRGFWLTVLSFQQFLEQRILSHHADIQSDFQENLMEYIGREEETPAVIDVADLPSPLKEEAQQLEARLSEELGPMRLETNLFMQKLIESDQGGRIKTMIAMVKREMKRLQIKKTLNGLFADGAGDDNEVEAEEAALSDRKTSREMAEAEQKLIEDFKRQLERSFGGIGGAEEEEDPSTGDEEFGLAGRDGNGRSSGGSSNIGGSFFLGSDGDAFQ